MASASSPSALPPQGGDSALVQAGPPPPASNTAKRSWNLDAPSYVPAVQTPTPCRTSGHQNRFHYQGYPNRQGPGNRDRGGFYRGGGRGRSGRNMPGMRNWNGRGYLGAEHNYSYHQAPVAHGPQYYGQAPRNASHTAYASPDPRGYYSDAVYLAGGLAPSGNPEQENLPYAYAEAPPDPTLYEAQDGGSFPLINDTDPDMHSIADSAATGTEYTQANSSLSCVDSLVTQSSGGSGFRGGRGFQRKHSAVAQSVLNGNSNPPPANMNSEARRMEQRQKQIDYGKNTSGYQRYISIVPKNRRKRSDPETPKRETRCSKRCWDGLIRQWRRELHVWDPPAAKEGEMPEWELPSMTEVRSTSQLNPLQETLRQEQSQSPSFGHPAQIRTSPAPSVMPARNLFEDTSSPTHRDFYPSWSEFSLAELDQKFASKIRPNETFEGFGLSPPKRDPDYSWGHCSIDQLDEKFGHKLRISEAVDFSWGPLPTNSSSSPFTPPARSKLFPSPFSYGEATPAESQLSSISPISKFKSRPQPVGSRPSPNGSPYGTSESLLTPRDRTPGSNRPMSEPRRLMPTMPDHSGSPLSLYSDDDDSVMIIVGSSASSIPSLASSGPSRTLSRTTTPPRTSTPGSVHSGNILTTPQTSIWANALEKPRLIDQATLTEGGEALGFYWARKLQQYEAAKPFAPSMDGGPPPPRSGSFAAHHQSSMSSASGRFLDELLNEYNYPSVPGSAALSRSGSTKNMETIELRVPPGVETTQTTPKADAAAAKTFTTRTDSVRLPAPLLVPSCPPAQTQSPISASSGRAQRTPHLSGIHTESSWSRIPTVPEAPLEVSTANLYRGDSSSGRHRARAQSATEDSPTLASANEHAQRGWFRAPNLHVNLKNRSTDDLNASRGDRGFDAVPNNVPLSAAPDAGSGRNKGLPSYSTPLIATNLPSSAMSIHSQSSKASASPPKSARSFLSVSSPNTLSKNPQHDHPNLTADREKKKGFISHLFGRRKEKTKEFDSASDSSSTAPSRLPERVSTRADAIDIGHSTTTEELYSAPPSKTSSSHAHVPSFSKKKAGKSQGSSKQDKRPQLDLSGFSMDPSYVPLDLVSINSPLSASSARSPYSNSPIGYATNPAVLPAPLAPSGPFGTPPPGPPVYLSPATSTWKPPESWGTKVNPSDGRASQIPSTFAGPVDRTTPKSISTSGNSPAAVSDGCDFKSEEFSFDVRGETDTIRSTADGHSDDKMCALRLFRRDGTFATISCRESTSAGDLLAIMAKKSLISDYTKFNVSIIRKGFERILLRDERPLMLQRRLFEQIGYLPSDKIELLGREDNSYLCRFLFKEVSVGNDVPQDFWRSTNFNTSSVSLARMNLTAVPLTCYRLASDIVSFDLSLNPNVQEIPNDLAQALESTKRVNMSQNELSKVPRSLQFINTLTEIDLSNNQISSLQGSGLENVTGLVKLLLGGNLIDQIPEELPRGCQKLEILDLSNNRLRSFPEELCRYLGKSLIHLDLNFCRIKGPIPESVGDLERLMYLRLAGNRAYGALPWRLGDLQQLQELDLRGNSFGYADGEEAMVMDVLCRCAKLETVRLDANRVRWVGRWADRLSESNRSSPAQRFEEDLDFSSSADNALEISHLKHLSLGSQVDPGRSMVFRLSNASGSLTELNISYCGIDYLPPNFFRRLPGLQVLNLNGNRMRDLPDFTGGSNLRDIRLELRELHVSNNFLEFLPDDIGELDNLIALDVKGNNLRELPAEIWRCRSLKIINASSNRLDSFPTPYPEDGTVLVATNNVTTFSRTGGFSFGTSFDRGNAMTFNRAPRTVEDLSQQTEAMQQQSNLPPLSHSLEHLYLSDNNLGDDFYTALYHMPNLLTLHAAFNEFTDITPWVVAIPLPVPMTPWFLKLQELHLSGNLISTLPGEIERIRTLRSLFLNGNKMSTVPGEVGKLKALECLDLGSQVGGRGEGTGLRYNVSNWPYDWNWNWNLDLKYLNLSGNKRLEIKPSTTASSFLAGSDSLSPANQPIPTAGHKVGARGGAIQAPATSGALVGNPSQRRRDLTDFNALTNLRLLGLMDVTCLIVPPDEGTERRIRTTGSDVPMVGLRGGVVRYGVADVLSQPIPQPLSRSPLTEYVPQVQHSLSKESDADTFEVWDLVIPKFRGRDNEALFAVFDGKGTSGGAKMAKYLNEWFGWFLANELERVERIEPTSTATQKRDRMADIHEVSHQMSRSASGSGPLKNMPSSKRPPLPVEPAERNLLSHVLDSAAITTALRRTFIAVNRELGSLGDELDEGLAGPQQQQQRTSSETRRNESPRQGGSRGSNKRGADPLPTTPSVRPLYGASALVVFLYGSTTAARRGGAKCTMYIANVGDGIAVMSKAGGTASVLSRHHVVDLKGLSRAEAQREQEQAKLALRSRKQSDDATASTAEESAAGLTGSLPWPLSEIERVQIAGGALSPSGKVDGIIPITRGFGYFPSLGAVNADPFIQSVELEVGDDGADEYPARPMDLRVAARQTSGEGVEEIDSPPSGSLNGGDEFAVLASFAVWNAVRCGGAYEDGAQMLVDIARSALAPSGGTGASAGSSNMMSSGLSGSVGGSSSGGIPGMPRSASNLGSAQQQSSKSTGGWGTAAMKVRDVALSLAGGQVGGGFLVMVLGLRDLAKKSTWWNAAGARRGSAESSVDSLNVVEERFRKAIPAASEVTTFKGQRKKGTEDAVDALTKEIAPPIGRLALVFTDIKNSTFIWETNPVAMRAALRLHHQVMRRLLRQTGGYEVKTEGDAFMVSFQNVSNAVEWCLTVQGELLNIDWPSEILSMTDGVDIWWQKSGASEFATGAMLEGGATAGAGSDVEVEMTDDDGKPNGERAKGGSGATAPITRRKRELVFKGLSVRMGIHFGNPLCEVDPITSRMDYYGPMVNRAARVASAAQGGQILISSDCMKELKRTLGWEESVEDGPLVDGIKSGEDLTDVVSFKADAPPMSPTTLQPGPPSSQQSTDEVARLKKLGVVTWCIGEVKLKGLETPEVIYAIYRRELYTRHRFFALEQSGGLHLITQAHSPSAAGSPQDSASASASAAQSASASATAAPPSPPKLVYIDRHMVKQMASLCVRLEWFASRNSEEWRSSSSSLPPALTSGEDEDDDEYGEEEPETRESRAKLIRQMEALVPRIESAISILHLETTPFSRALQSLGAAIETDPNHILRAITMYAEKLDERQQRKRQEQLEKQKRREARAKRRAQKEAAAASAAAHAAANGDADPSSSSAPASRTSSRHRRERKTSPTRSTLATGGLSPPLSSSSSRARQRDRPRPSHDPAAPSSSPLSVMQQTQYASHHSRQSSETRHARR
ncbi:cysteinyl-tRNA synthetase [Geranomyces michiganensis]|nr:cysteinyl-tRNA synthetase [Geranomyces michiganensis]